MARCFLVGGIDNGLNQLSSAELYDPAEETWSPTASMNDARQNHTATLLPDGEVLVAGGEGSSFSSGSSAEIYDPESESWTLINPMNSSRYGHTATLLPNGDVLVLGGLNAQSTFAGAEVFTPLSGDALSGSWTATNPTKIPRIYHTATLLRDGRVLVAGGLSTMLETTNAVETYDWTIATVAMPAAEHTARAFHQAILLPDGRVLVAGGQNNSTILTNTELYDPATGIWTTTNSLNCPRLYFTMTLLPDGKVLAAGGDAANGAPTNSAELFDPTTGIWTLTGSMNTPRAQHAATVLANGKVLVVGGITSGSGVPTNSTELYDPASGTWTSTSPLNTARAAPTATLLANGKVLVAAGYAATGVTNSAELYDAVAGTWTITGTLNASRYLHTATLLPNGRVLVAGGVGNGGPLSGAEVYNPATELWTAIPAMPNPHYSHTATLLPQGKVLIAGGQLRQHYPLHGAIRSRDEHVDFEYTHERGSRGHTATLLADGKVLLVGGLTNGTPVPLSSAELYDPGLGFNAAWQPQITTVTSPLDSGSSPGADRVAIPGRCRSFRREQFAKLIFGLSGRAIEQHRERSNPFSPRHQLVHQFVRVPACNQFPARLGAGHSVCERHSRHFHHCCVLPQCRRASS